MGILVQPRSPARTYRLYPTRRSRGNPLSGLKKLPTEAAGLKLPPRIPGRFSFEEMDNANQELEAGPKPIYDRVR